MSTKPDLLGVVEAAYEVDAPDEKWLSGLADAARPFLDQGFGLSAFEFLRDADGLPEILQCRRIGMPPGLDEIYSTVFERMDPRIRQKPFRMGPCITGSQLMGMRKEFRDHPYMKQHVQKFGMYDTIWITAAEPSGRGFGFHAGRKKVGWASPALMSLWGRLAAHLSTAVRLRHRLKTLGQTGSHAPNDAIFNPDGKVQDASGIATEKSARTQLQTAVRVLETVRGSMRRKNPNEALLRWKALVTGRWSLVDKIENDGRRYIVARQNEPSAPGPSSLSPRERQIIGYAKLGHHNKLIAYELGIADTTVRVLLARAAAKLGVRKRSELLTALTEVNVDVQQSQAQASKNP
jgi:DNA-binding CsgD family transcriptional regulator